MEVVSLQVCDLECLHLLVGDLDALLVGVGVEYRLDRQTGLGGGRRDRLDDNLVGFQGSTAPVHGDRGEHPVLDFVPFGGARWQVAHGDLQTGLGGQLAQFGLPQPQPGAVGPAAVRGDQQRLGVGVGGVADLGPPAADRLDRERADVGIGADVDPAGVRADVTDPVGRYLAQLPDEVVLAQSTLERCRGASVS